MAYQKKGQSLLDTNPYAHGGISWYVKVIEGTKISSSLRINDCSDYVLLEFNSDSKSIDKRLAKLDVLIDQMLAMKEALSDAKKRVQPAKVY